MGTASSQLESDFPLPGLAWTEVVDKGAFLTTMLEKLLKQLPESTLCKLDKYEPSQVVLTPRSKLTDRNHRIAKQLLLMAFGVTSEGTHFDLPGLEKNTGIQSSNETRSFAKFFKRDAALVVCCTVPGAFPAVEELLSEMARVGCVGKGHSVGGAVHIQQRLLGEVRNLMTLPKVQKYIFELGPERSFERAPLVGMLELLCRSAGKPSKGVTLLKTAVESTLGKMISYHSLHVFENGLGMQRDTLPQFNTENDLDSLKSFVSDHSHDYKLRQGTFNFGNAVFATQSGVRNLIPDLPVFPIVMVTSVDPGSTPYILDGHHRSVQARDAIGGNRIRDTWFLQSQAKEQSGRSMVQSTLQRLRTHPSTAPLFLN